MSGYKLITEASVFGKVSFTLQAEQGKADLEENVGLLRTEKTDLEKQVVELRARADQVERRANELRSAEEKKHAEEIQFLKKTNTQLKVRLMGSNSRTNALQRKKIGAKSPAG
uniref:Uncharacterized protein n=1 Tax=Timema poppense TaxID=170557 RepID=A0A7R9GTB0_TIMPO|nr:unnamed protein product [Timema poppensis]